MWSADAAVRVLRARGELWQSAPGLVGLRGAPLRLLCALDDALASFAMAEDAEAWRVPAGIALETLERADYFASFPQWLTVASHLDDTPGVLERVAAASSASLAARDAVAPADAALAPAVCYHVYAGLTGAVLTAPRIVTVQGTCWRHEGARFAPLERGWAFTMRELVCLGDAGEVEAFRQRGMRRAIAFAESLALAPRVVAAADPFFAPRARGRAILQRVKGLKHELALPLGDEREVAAASFNHHERFFGDAFDIRLADGTLAESGCVAFGLERWLLGILVAHGPDESGWPDPAGAASGLAEV